MKLLISILFVAQIATAQNTVGDLLRKAREESRGAKVKTEEKKSVFVPTTNNVFEQVNSNLNDVKPPNTEDIYEFDSEDQAHYEKTLNLQINELYKLTQKMKDSPNRGELWVRLAELYVEKAGLVENRIQDQYDRDLKLFLDKKTATKPILDLKNARDYNKKAIQLYEWFLKEFPNDPKHAQALFFLGYNYTEVGNISLGAQYYSKLTERYPNGIFSGDSYFAIGEFHFDNERWSDAYKQYAFLIKNVKHSLHTLALYKAAWCLYRLGKTSEGIKYLDYIVKSGKQNINKNSVTGRKINKARLEGEALKDLVTFFADLSDPKKAIEYFNANAKSPKIFIERLAYQFADEGNKSASNEVFKYLIKIEPDSKKSFEYQYQIVQSNFFAKNMSDFKIELEKWISNYNSKSSWYSAQKNDEVFLKKSDLLREQTLRNYILQQHQTAQNSRAKFSQDAAFDGYKLFFKEFPDSKNRIDMHFFFAELLYDMEKFESALNEYRIVVDHLPKSNFYDKAMLNIMICSEKMLPKDEELQKSVGNSLTPLAKDPRIENYYKTATWFIEKNPTSNKVLEIKFKIGRLNYLTNNFDSAEEKFKEIVQKHPNTLYSDYSANLLLDIYNLKKDYSGLERIGAELLSTESISKSKVGNDIRNVLERTSFKKAQILESEKKYLPAAEQFQLFAMQNMQSKLTPTAHYNAAINFERASQLKNAIAQYNKVLAFKSPEYLNIRNNSQRFLAKLYQDTGQFEESANMYKELIISDPESKYYSGYLYNAALLNTLINRVDAAISNYEKFIASKTSVEENIEASFKLAQIFRDKNQLSTSLNYYKKCMNAELRSASIQIECTYWVAQISKVLSEKSKKQEFESKIIEIVSKFPASTEGSKKYLAKIKLLYAQDTFNKVKVVSIPIDAKLQKNAVDKKLELMNQLNEELGEVIKLNSSDEIVTSLYLLGAANEHMGQSIASVPTPSNLNEEQKQKYMAGVEGIVSPFLKKSYESYRLAIDRGMSLGSYNEAFKLSYAKLAKKFPNENWMTNEIINDNKIIEWISEK